MFKNVKTLILASSSPRRQDFLRDLGISFSVVPPQDDEGKPLPNEEPLAYAARIAKVKAKAVAALRPEAFVLGADTIVVLDKSILGKPENAEEALEMLSRLSGNRHMVITACCLVLPRKDNDAEALCVEYHGQAFVRFGDWPKDILQAYVQSGECMDRAGSYAIQGLGAFLVAGIEGCWSNVVGLPVGQTVQHLLEQGIIEI